MNKPPNGISGYDWKLSRKVGNRNSRCVQLLYQNSLLFGQFAGPMKFTPRSKTSSLRYHISTVIRIVTKPEVFRSNTRRIVAFVQNVHSSRSVLLNRSNVKHPTSDVSHEMHLLYSRPYSSVAIYGRWSRPHPTRTQFRSMRRHRSILIHLRPKPCGERFRKSLRSQILRSNIDHSSVSTPFGLQAQRRFPLTTIPSGLKEDQAIYA